MARHQACVDAKSLEPEQNFPYEPTGSGFAVRGSGREMPLMRRIKKCLHTEYGERESKESGGSERQRPEAELERATLHC